MKLEDEPTFGLGSLRRHFAMRALRAGSIEARRRFVDVGKRRFNTDVVPKLEALGFENIPVQISP